MSKKRQNRNTKKMRQAVSSKRARAKYNVGGYNPRDGVYTLPDGTTYKVPGNQNNDNTSSVPGGTSKREAPIDLPKERPDPVILPEVKVKEVEVGPESETMQMDAVAPAKQGTAAAAIGTAKTTGPATLAETPTAVPASTYEAALVEALPKGEAAQGEVSEEAVAKFVPGTLTQAPEAAKRDAAQEQAALADTVTYTISNEAFIDPVTGEEAKVSATPEAEEKSRREITGKAADDAEAAVR